MVDVQSVDSPDAPAQYTVDNNGSDVSVKIGDPNQTVTGEHTYTLTYLVRGSLNAFADHDELYWNAVGDQWDVPIDQAAVQVTAPADVTRAACFAGPLGSTAPCQQAGITSGVARFSQAGLGPNEGLTVVVAIPKGVVALAGPVLRERWSLRRAFAVTPVSAGMARGLLAVLAVLGAVVLARAGTAGTPDPLRMSWAGQRSRRRKRCHCPGTISLRCSPSRLRMCGRAGRDAAGRRGQPPRRHGHHR